MDLYRELLLDHYKNPRNFGKLKTGKGTAFESNPSCGDKIGVAIKVNKKGEIGKISFWGEGCVVSMAAASMLTEEVMKRKKLENIKKINEETVLEMLGGKKNVPPARFRCALLGFNTLRSALMTGLVLVKEHPH